MSPTQGRWIVYTPMTLLEWEQAMPNRSHRGSPSRLVRRVFPRVLPISTIALAWLLAGCAEATSDRGQDHEAMRDRMVETQIVARGIENPRVLEAMRKVPRHLFVPETSRDRAYADGAMSIGMRQTISQPFVVAAMSEALDPQPGDTVLEIGTGSGYQAAVLAELVKRVYSIEIIPELAERARADLAKNGYDNVEVIVGDGYDGLPDLAPFDGIIVTAAPPKVPQPLIDQLAVGARLVIPVGVGGQDLQVLERGSDGIVKSSLFPVIFVPMTGKAQER
jgi:protein-L-isoaspartate(D-aspartate) O-methyltransferase